MHSNVISNFIFRETSGLKGALEYVRESSESKYGYLGLHFIKHVHVSNQAYSFCNFIPFVIIYLLYFSFSSSKYNQENIICNFESAHHCTKYTREGFQSE